MRSIIPVLWCIFCLFSSAFTAKVTAQKPKYFSFASKEARVIQQMCATAGARNDILTLSWLLSTVPVFACAGNEKLKEFIAKFLHQKLSSDSEYLEKLKRYLEDANYFFELSLLVMYTEAHVESSVLQELVFGTEKLAEHSSPKKISFIEKILNSTNLTLYQALSKYLQSHYDKNIKTTFALAKILSKVPPASLNAFLILVFPPEIRETYPKFTLMLSRLPNIPNGAVNAENAELHTSSEELKEELADAKSGKYLEGFK